MAVLPGDRNRDSVYDQPVCYFIYYYSTYGPTLNFLHGSSLTTWMTGFFLPHYAYTSSSLLNGAHTAGRIFLVIGVLFFLIGAGHIYYYKFTKKGAVTDGLYKIIRHPQYTALTVMGLGLFYWSGRVLPC